MQVFMTTEGPVQFTSKMTNLRWNAVVLHVTTATNAQRHPNANWR